MAVEDAGAAQNSSCCCSFCHWQQMLTAAAMESYNECSGCSCRKTSEMLYIIENIENYNIVKTQNEKDADNIAEEDEGEGHNDD